MHAGVRSMTMITSAQFKASHELEEMLPHLREIVNEIRDGEVDAYASLYEARRRLTKILAPLGAGVPSRQAKAHRWL